MLSLCDLAQLFFYILKTDSKSVKIAELIKYLLERLDLVSMFFKCMKSEVQRN